MFTSIIAKIKRLVIQRKQQQLKNSITLYAAAVNKAVPVSILAYQEAAHVIVDKTFEKPEVLLNLANALDQALVHYGPALDDVCARFNRRVNYDAVQVPLEAFIESLKELE